MSADLALQNAMFSVMTGSVALAALLATNEYESPQVAAVYDQAPQMDESEDSSKFPYIVLGDDTAIEFDTDDVNGKEYTVTLHIWDRYHGRKRVKQVMDALYTLLHDTDLTVSGHHTIYCYFEFSTFVPEDDNLTKHGVVRFRIVTQEA